MGLHIEYVLLLCVTTSIAIAYFGYEYLMHKVRKQVRKELEKQKRKEPKQAKKR